MNAFRQFLGLIRKEIVLEWRQKYAISGILLYVVSTVFVVYLSFANARINPVVWNVLLWIIILFASVNAVAKSFYQESGARQLYYYTLADPYQVLLSKIVYNFFLMLLLSALAFFSLSMFSSNALQRPELFAVALLLGSLGLAAVFTFISGIATKAKNSATLMAVLGFPAVIPMLLMLVKLSAGAVGMGMDSQEGYQKDILLLSGIDTIIIAVSIILFPYLWRD
jgi:heme exporter protein B